MTADRKTLDDKAIDCNIKQRIMEDFHERNLYTYVLKLKEVSNSSNHKISRLYTTSVRRGASLKYLTSLLQNLYKKALQTFCILATTNSTKREYMAVKQFSSCVCPDAN
jgi:hypothetical protein